MNWRPVAAGGAENSNRVAEPDLRVGAAEEADCAAIARVHVRAWQLAYQRLLPADYLRSLAVDERESMWHHALATGTPQVCVARRAQQPVIGFVAFGPSREPGAGPDEGEIWALYVDPQAWCMGAGRLLCRTALDRLRRSGCRSVGLWVIDGNERAQRFYAGTGFHLQPGSRQPFNVGSAQVHEVRYRLDDVGAALGAVPDGWARG